MMKKSGAVQVPLLSTVAVAALAAGCGSPRPSQPQGWQTCVERAQGTAVEPRYCDDEGARSRTSGHAPQFGWYYYPYGYYWGAPGFGSRVPEGGTWGAQPFPSAPMARTGAVVRGGLGSTATGHASAGE